MMDILYSGFCPQNKAVPLSISETKQKNKGIVSRDEHFFEGLKNRNSIQMEVMRKISSPALQVLESGHFALKVLTLSAC